MTTLVVIEGLVILLLAVLVAGLLRSHAEILRRLHALGAGEETGRSIPLFPGRRSREAPVEGVVGVTPEGTAVSVALRETRGITLLAFLSSGCATCHRLWTEPPDQSEVRTVVVTKGPAEESPAEVRRLAPPWLTTIMSTEAWEAFQVPFTPYFVLVDAANGSVLGDGSAAGWEQVNDLVRRAMADTAHRSTRRRLEDTDEELRRAGIRPNDPSLYRNPLPGDRS